MWFTKCNLNRALYYTSFNFITLFHFQYFASDPIIFGYNNISMILFVCQIGVVIYPIPYLSLSYQIYLDLPFFPLLVL
jgi:hypothetical protein